MKQQVDHALAAGSARDQRGDAGSYAAQTGQWREKRGKRVGVQRRSHPNRAYGYASGGRKSE